MEPEPKFHQYMTFEGDTIRISVERDVSVISEGESFSSEALDNLQEEIWAFIGSRIMRRWDATDEPPTVLTVEVKASAA